MNSSSDSSTTEANSPEFRNTLTTTSCVTVAKNILGKFTTANFIETTISSSPANFGNIAEKEKKGKAATAANLPESPVSSVFPSNADTLESKGSRSNLTVSSKSSERKVGRNADSKLLANFKMSEGASRISESSDKGGRIAEVRNGGSSPNVTERSMLANSHPNSVLATASKSILAPTFTNFLPETATSGQCPPAGSTSTETYDSELSDTPMNNKRSVISQFLF